MNLVSQELEKVWLSDFGGRYPNTFSYFSGSQVVIFAGDIFIDEAVFLSYNLRQNKKPVYGYASAYWDAIATGTVLVEGSLAINYVDNKYLPLILYDNARRRHVLEPRIPQPTSNLDHLSYLANLAGYNLLNRSGREAFQGAVDTLKQLYWEKTNTSQNTMPRTDQMPPVDIYITYGSQKSSWGSTVKKLEQATFVGESQTIELGGQPILEVYNFIARRILNVLKADIPAKNT